MIRNDNSAPLIACRRMCFTCGVLLWFGPLNLSSGEVGSVSFRRSTRYIYICIYIFLLAYRWVESSAGTGTHSSPSPYFGRGGLWSVSPVLSCLRDSSGLDFGAGGDAGATPFGEHLHRAANSIIKPTGAAAGGVGVGVVW